MDSKSADTVTVVGLPIGGNCFLHTCLIIINFNPADVSRISSLSLFSSALIIYSSTNDCIPFFIHVL